MRRSARPPRRVAPPALGEQHLQFGALERVAVGLVDARLGVVGGQFRNVLPGIAVAQEIIIGVLHPDHGHVLPACPLDQGADVRDHAGSVVSLCHHPVLDVDDEECGVRPVGGT